MLFSSPLIQATAALVIFVVGYLVLLVVTVACLGLAIVFYKCARILGSYVMSVMRRLWLARNVALVTHRLPRHSQ
jgi:hypothetical protein